MATAKKKSQKRGHHAKNSRSGRFFIPKSVNVLGHTYRVQFMPREKINPDHRSGECQWPERIIRIATEIRSNKKYAWLVFLHEIRHAYQYEAGDMQILSSQATEKDADGFASFIASLKRQRVL